MKSYDTTVEYDKWVETKEAERLRPKGICVCPYCRGRGWHENTYGTTIFKALCVFCKGEGYTKKARKEKSDGILKNSELV